MARPVSEAERLRQCRLVFQRAVQDRVSMGQAQIELSLERIRERQRRIEVLRNRVASEAARAEPEFLDQMAARKRAFRDAANAYARTCALLGEHEESDGE